MQEFPKDLMNKVKLRIGELEQRLGGIPNYVIPQNIWEWIPGGTPAESGDLLGSYEESGYLLGIGREGGYWRVIIYDALHIEGPNGEERNIRKGSKPMLFTDAPLPIQLLAFSRLEALIGRFAGFAGQLTKQIDAQPVVTDRSPGTEG